MKKDDLIKDIQESIVALVNEKYSKKSKEIEKEIAAFLKETEESLFRWTLLLQEKKITEKEFELLLSAQKDVFIINQLYQLGVSKISLGHFKNKILNLIINKVLLIIL